MRGSKRARLAVAAKAEWVLVESARDGADCFSALAPRTLAETQKRRLQISKQKHGATRARRHQDARVSAILFHLTIVSVPLPQYPPSPSARSGEIGAIVIGCTGNEHEEELDSTPVG
ncbi:hypothetical protein MVEN_02311100 [Mycena venus]|uniref:Uncharacterized protein n=1 Tax=Mycena venus TaxID=2733690 RepID=A0A8H6X4M6_9AGAR|nr:hypothetical protein MVEN_02311100 [Mycena venus]